MNLRLGFFTEFKDADSVLLEGSRSGIDSLAYKLGAFVASEEESLSIHSLATVAPHHSVQLFVVRSAFSAAALNLSGFLWQVSIDELPSTQARLRELAQSPSGHQYFDLVGSTTQLIVSHGEYGESWWHSHG